VQELLTGDELTAIVQIDAYLRRLRGVDFLNGK